jgi:micrococcal nuclease
MTTMPTQAWVYRAKLERVIDGDTLQIQLDMGLHAYRVERLRLLGVNAPEVHGATKAAGDAATAYVREWLAAAGADPWPLVVQTYRTDNFGRYLGAVWRVVDGANLSNDLIYSGNAVAYRDGQGASS